MAENTITQFKTADNSSFYNGTSLATFPSPDLPYEQFMEVSRETPLINVDLLISDENNRLLFAWRDDDFYGKGWHIVGGVIRLGETIETRIRETCNRELGFIPFYEPRPCKITEFLYGTEYRGHNIALMYRCHCLASDVRRHPEGLGGDGSEAGDLRWFEECPEPLLPAHEEYRWVIETWFRANGTVEYYR